MLKVLRWSCVSLGVFLFAAPADAAGVQLAAEGMSVWQSRNEFAVPGTTGTRLDVADGDTGPWSASRFTLTWDYSERSSLRLLVAPLSISTQLTPNAPVTFQDFTFQAASPLRVDYRFNSYRLSWVRRFEAGSRWSFRLGVTGKIRDAEIHLSNAAGEQVKGNVGFVPLLHVGARFALTERVGLDFEADALAAPQGRAEDVACRLMVDIGKGLELSAGYRILEGGADNDEVYTFALFHYATAGLSMRF